MGEPSDVRYCHWCAEAGLVTFGHNGFSLKSPRGTVTRWACAKHRQAGKEWSAPAPLTPGPEPKQKSLL